MSSRRRRREQALALYIVSRERQEALNNAPDPESRARLTAQYQRELLGFVDVKDLQAHYLCDLGLRDRLPSPPRRDTAHEPTPIIRTRARP